MATTVTTTYEVIKRDPSTGKIFGGLHSASSAVECAQTAALSGIGSYISAWQTLAWKKSVADAFWADPATVVQGQEDPDGPVAFEVFVMRKVITVVDDPAVQSTETRYEAVPA